jgi:succinate dehydrogenase / fumarate reductase membrane anchor subunit
MNSTRWARPESLLEVYSWIFMRVSGVVLVALALGHLAIMHLVNNVDVINYDFVAHRFIGPFWRTYDFILLWLAMIHGLNGVRIMIDDYLIGRGWRTLALSVLAVVGVVFLTLGSLVIVTFQPLAAGR